MRASAGNRVDAYILMGVTVDVGPEDDHVMQITPAIVAHLSGALNGFPLSMAECRVIYADDEHAPTVRLLKSLIRDCDDYVHRGVSQM